MSTNRLLGYIDKQNKSEAERAYKEKYKNTDRYITEQVKTFRQGLVEQTMRDLVSSIYVESLPIRDDCVLAPDALPTEMNQFISKQCPEGFVVYVKKLPPSNPAAKMCGDVEKYVDKQCFVMETNLKKKKEDYGSIETSDIDAESDAAKERLSDDVEELKNKYNIDDVEETLANNVKSAVSAEVEASKAVIEQNKALEDDLRDDLEITTKESVERELSLRSMVTRKKGPITLLEGIIIGKMNDPIINESVREEKKQDAILVEAVKEYTKHSVWKALRLGTYDLPKVKRLASEYAVNNI